MAARLPVHFLQKSAHHVEFRAEARPVSGFQSLDCFIVVVKCLAGPVCRRACERRSRRDTRGHWRGAGFEERRQCLGECLLHHHMIAIGCDHALEREVASAWRHSKTAQTVIKLRERLQEIDGKAVKS
jgi:hypothetical protein